jgi:hypothetical protein
MIIGAAQMDGAILVFVIFFSFVTFLKKSKKVTIL